MQKKTDEYSTKNDLRESVDAILVGMNNIYLELIDKMATKDDLKKLETKLESRMENIETEVGFVRQDISDIKADLSLTPTRREFNELKTKVDRIVSTQVL